MASVYKFVISMPVTDTLPRNRITNTVHFQHVVGSQDDNALEGMCSDLVEMWATRYGNATKEIQCKAYDTDAVPNYPRAVVTQNAGVTWTVTTPPEVALCLSFAGSNRGNKRERGRIYLMPQISATASGAGVRPLPAQMDWALDFFRAPNASLPDIGGIDWKFGVLSKVAGQFTQAQQAWVNDDWDHVRRRSTRESTRVTSVREG